MTSWLTAYSDHLGDEIRGYRAWYGQIKILAPLSNRPSVQWNWAFAWAGTFSRTGFGGRKRFPLVTMLEPLEMCNLACIGCGRIREYRGVLDQMMPVEEALDAVHKSGAPIVSIAGGEPTIHPKIDEIINTLIDEKYFVYCCTNALLLPRMLDKIPPSKYFCWVIHMDGMEEKHDESVARSGVFKRAVDGIQMAVGPGISGLHQHHRIPQQRRRGLAGDVPLRRRLGRRRVDDFARL